MTLLLQRRPPINTAALSLALGAAVFFAPPFATTSLAQDAAKAAVHNSTDAESTEKNALKPTEVSKEKSGESSPQKSLQNSPQRLCGKDKSASPWTWYWAPYTYHYSEAKVEAAGEPDVKHAYVWAVGTEYTLGCADDAVAETAWNDHFVGFSYFSNSFGQPSQYLYLGKRYQPFTTWDGFFAKWTAGILHGYKAPFDKKIPINTPSGWGLGFVPSLGWSWRSGAEAQLNFLGTAGLMLQLNYRY